MHGIDVSERVPNRRRHRHIKAIFRQQGPQCEPNAFFILDEQKTCWRRFRHRDTPSSRCNCWVSGGSTKNNLSNLRTQSDVCLTRPELDLRGFAYFALDLIGEMPLSDSCPSGQLTAPTLQIKVTG